MLKTEAQVRRAFWAAHPHAKRNYINGNRRPQPAPQNWQPADTRMAFVDYVDQLARGGEISEALASRVTL